MNPQHAIRRRLVGSTAKVLAMLAVCAAILLWLFPRMTGEYGASGPFDRRLAIWFVAQLHLMFAAFVLGVPIFAVIAEVVGIATKDERYDRLAREFTRLLALAVTATALLGVLLLLGLVIFYPKFMRYMDNLFSPTYLPYVACIVADTVLLVLYYYGWGRMKKWLHVGVGVALNLFGTALICIANAWGTFMMSPAGVDEQTGATISLSAAIQNPLWWPINIHRIIANVAFGGAIVGAYAAIRFLHSRTDEEKVHYDWMGYVGNFVAMFALIPLPFAGYWLAKEIYAYSAQMGTTLMGGAFSWLFIIQAVLIATLFISANYYFWLGLGRIPGGGRYMKYIFGLEAMIFLCAAIWLTPHTLVASLAEARKMGGSHHPLLGVFGVMSAKNTAVNIIILTTFLSFLFYRRANKKRAAIVAGSRRPYGPLFVLGLSAFPVLFCGVNGFFSEASRAEKEVPRLEAEVTAEAAALEGVKMGEAAEKLKQLDRKSRMLERMRLTAGIHHTEGYRFLAIFFSALALLALADMFVLRGRIGGLLQGFIMLGAAAIVIYYGIKGYFVEAEVRIGYSVYQVMSVLFAMVSVMAIDLFIFTGAESLGKIQWGKMPPRSQYVLILLAVVFTLLMGLMGFVRSGIRETWHVYGVLRDTSPENFNPTMGYASSVITAATLTFFALLFVIFRFGMRARSA